MARPCGPALKYLHMSPEKAAEIRRAYFGREAKQQALAERYGVTQATISRIISGDTWN
jgi:DNA-binding transcriptional regulator LsrR (DeoR family)